MYKLIFTSWLFVEVFRANKYFEEVQNWFQTTLKEPKTWWNQKSPGWLFTIRAKLRSAKGQYAANSLFWLATGAGKIERYYPPGTVRFVPANKISPKFKQVPKLFSAKLIFCDFSAFMEPEKASTGMKIKKTKMLMSFKNTFYNKKRPTQKLNLKIWIWNLKCNQSNDCIFCIYSIRI